MSRLERRRIEAQNRDLETAGTGRVFLPGPLAKSAQKIGHPNLSSEVLGPSGETCATAGGGDDQAGISHGKLRRGWRAWALSALGVVVHQKANRTRPRRRIEAKGSACEPRFFNSIPLGAGEPMALRWLRVARFAWSPWRAAACSNWASGEGRLAPRAAGVAWGKGGPDITFQPLHDVAVKVGDDNRPTVGLLGLHVDHAVAGVIEHGDLAA